ncbi:dihydrodipicolinate synthase family protein [Paenibacillus spongiae]|uniref:Dihydrodipicolinate synthase family protein n=1 Tax=Paenibacillus spongiae TaxID=2909671 RepID=A0ABY5SHR9_9BACL|nr:dihydrodipicolinate synthase family protein [Paenibacillus spongiae]UVI33128.1 dihydrodipicolinate synthase family protein [Paenibacillus spongiae]
MLTEQTLHGVIVPVITPFDRRGNLDVKSFEGLVTHLVDNGVHGLVVNGMTGEAAILKVNELETLITTARKAARRIPVIVGIGSSSTSTAVRRTAWVKSLGADAVLAYGPYYSRPSQQRIIQHFQALAEAELPVIAVDHTSRTRTSMELETVQAIMKMDHVIGLNECIDDITRTYKLARSMTKPVLCGEDELFFASLCGGGKGGILTSANLDSELFVQVYELYRDTKVEEANQLFNQLLPLIQFAFSEPNHASLKWLLTERGHIVSDRLRIPMTSFNHQSSNKVLL